MSRFPRSRLRDLSDVDLTGVTAGQVLTLASGGKFVGADPGSAPELEARVAALEAAGGVDLSGYATTQSVNAAVATLQNGLDTLSASMASDSELAAAVASLQSAINAKQNASDAATDSELAALQSSVNSALATVQTSLAGKQDAATAATDSELAAAVATLQAADATKQDASTAATDAELAAAVATVNSAVALKISISEKGAANGVAALGSDALLALPTLPARVRVAVSRAWEISGSIASTFPRSSARMDGANILSGGELLLAGGAVLPAGVAVNNIRFHSSAQALAGGTHQWACIVDQSRNVLAKSQDLTSSAWASSALKTFPLASPYTPGVDTPVYLGLLVTATTLPQLLTLFNNNAPFIAQTPNLAGRSTTGLSDPSTLGATAAALSTNVTSNPWADVT